MIDIGKKMNPDAVKPAVDGNRMLEGRVWKKRDGASSEALDRLQEVTSGELPDSYLSLLSYTNGGEGPLPVQPLWIVLYPAEEVVQIQKTGTFLDFFPGLLVIGGNGGGEAIAIDLRYSAPYPLVYFDMVNSDLSESVQRVATSFDEALNMIGLDSK